VETIRQIVKRVWGYDTLLPYCIHRAEVEQLAEALRRRGDRVVPFHAGLADAERRGAQDDFLTERVEVVVATVVFGMGIDRSDVRFVIHAGMPKSIERYQREAAVSRRVPRDAMRPRSGGPCGG
jgi:ATP-dependent DNA helicase RecQ